MMIAAAQQGERIAGEQVSKESDVILGSKRNQTFYPGIHPRNFKKVIAQRYEDYKRSGKLEKRKFAKDTLVEAKKAGCRFLENLHNDENNYIEVTDEKRITDVIMREFRKYSPPPPPPLVFHQQQQQQWFANVAPSKGEPARAKAKTDSDHVDSSINGANGMPNVVVESPVAAKRRAMEEAVKKRDFITAGQLQSEVQYLESKGVESTIAAKRREMDSAALNKDYILAGRLQAVVRHLEKHKKRLQDLEHRMFEAAAKQDFIRAGWFQEQYDTLMKAEEKAGAAGTTASMWDQGGGGSVAYAMMGPPMMGPTPSSMGTLGPLGPPPPEAFAPYDY